jgi:Polysaccharide lyase
MSYGYQWKRCDSTGGSCAAISGATSSSYQLGSGDVGATVRLAVTASNSAGSSTATSLATPLVSAPDTNPTGYYYDEAFDGAYSNPIWNPDPSSAMSWTTGYSGQALRITDCASSDATHPCQTSTSSYGQVSEDRVWGTYAHAGWLPGSSTDLSRGNGQPEDSWYRFKLRLPAGYKATPGSQNTVFEFHLDSKTQTNASSVGANAYSTLIGVAADPPSGYTVDTACPGTPHFCTVAGTNPRLYLQIAGGVIPAANDGVLRVNMPSGSLLIDHWYDVVLHVYWSPDATVGHVQWWLDGTKVADTYHATEYTRTDGTLSYGANMGFMNYRYWANWSAAVDSDELTWGPDAGSVGFNAP